MDKITREFPTLNVTKNYMKAFVSEMVDILMIGYPDINQIEDLLEDTLYNGRTVIDELADHEIYDVFNSRKPLVLITQLWSGKYEQEFFLNYSINFRIIRDLVFHQNDFVGIHPDYSCELSPKMIYKNYKERHSKALKSNYVIKKRVKSHFFMMKIWKITMGTRYMIDAVFIIVIAVILQVFAFRLQETVADYYKIYPNYLVKLATLSDTSLTPSELATAEFEFTTVETQLLNTSYDAYDWIARVWYIYLILVAYFVRNICQIVYARIRFKDWLIIKPEFFIS